MKTPFRIWPLDFAVTVMGMMVIWCLASELSAPFGMGPGPPFHEVLAALSSPFVGAWIVWLVVRWFNHRDERGCVPRSMSEQKR